MTTPRPITSSPLARLTAGTAVASPPKSEENKKTPLSIVSAESAGDQDGNFLPGPSPLPLEPAACRDCGSPFAWVDAYGGASCLNCRPPARPAMVRQKLVLIGGGGGGSGGGGPAQWIDHRVEGDADRQGGDGGEKEKKFVMLRGEFRVAAAESIFREPFDWIPPGLSFDGWWHGEGLRMHEALLEAGESARVLREEAAERAARKSVGATEKEKATAAAAANQAASRLDFDRPAEPAHKVAHKFDAKRESEPSVKQKPMEELRPASPKKQKGAGGKRPPAPNTKGGADNRSAEPRTGSGMLF